MSTIKVDTYLIRGLNLRLSLNALIISGGVEDKTTSMNRFF